MGAAAAPIAIGGSIASAGFKAAGDIAAGEAGQAAANAKAADADFAAGRAERAAEFGRVQADQTDAQMREGLQVQIANIDAIRASSNIDPRSPTGEAIDEYQTNIGDRQRRNQVASIRLQAAEDDRMAQYDTNVAVYQRQVGKSALSAGYVGALADVTGGIAKGFGGKS